MDGDSAGQKAAWRTVVNALPALRSGRKIKVLLLDEGQDPDSTVREKGKSFFEQLIDNASPLSNYFFDYLAKEHSLDSIEGRASFAEQAKPLLNTLPAGAFSELMKKQLARLTKMDGGVSKAPPPARFGARQALRGTAKKSPSAIRRLITALLHAPELASLVDKSESWFQLESPGMPVLRQILSLCVEGSAPSPAILLERFRGSEYEKTINTLFAEERLITGESLEQELLGSIERLKEQAKETRYEELLAKSTGLSDEEKKELRELMK